MLSPYTLSDLNLRITPFFFSKFATGKYIIADGRNSLRLQQSAALFRVDGSCVLKIKLETVQQTKNVCPRCERRVSQTCEPVLSRALSISPRRSSVFLSNAAVRSRNPL